MRWLYKYGNSNAGACAGTATDTGACQPMATRHGVDVGCDSDAFFFARKLKMAHWPVVE
jgi:hypothetical protein